MLFLFVMQTLTEFKASLQAAQPQSGLSAPLKGLWFDGKGDWHRAHAEVDTLSGEDAAWVHAYLHRKEGDTWNADYWYGKAHKIRPDIDLEAEWEQLAQHFLS